MCDFFGVSVVPFDLGWNMTLADMNSSMHGQRVQHYLPYSMPADYQSMPFGEFLEEHILRYEGQPYSYDHRMLATMSYPTEDIFGELTSDFECEYRDFFVGARGSGVNFHEHLAIDHYLLSGSKMWFFVEDYSVIADVLGPMEAIGPKVETLKSWPGVSVCVLEAGEMMHVPKNVIHGVFNLETSISAGCLEYNYK